MKKTKIQRPEVGSHVILDIVTEDETWFQWSCKTLAQYAETHILVINPIIDEKISIGFDRMEDVEIVISPAIFRKEPLPWEAAFLAGKCFLAYRRRGGKRRSTRLAIELISLSSY